MSGPHCHCGSAGCRCCEGVAPLTPVPTSNRPGLPALRYRTGTHGAFFETMKGRLATMEVDATAADGQTIERVRPLVGLTTRDAGDPAIALLDAWATVGDVLTFYQERIANEGYLRTATERRSVLELARLVGYALRPGVASTVYLAYLLEDLQLLPVQIDAGARAQSIPGPGEQPQSFETGDPLTARTEWNDLQVRRARPQRITFDNALSIERIYIAGIAAGPKKGDLLLLAFDSGPSVVRVVFDPIAEPENVRTSVVLQPVPPQTVAALPALSEFIEAAAAVVDEPGQGAAGRMLERAQEIVEASLLGVYMSPLLWTESLTTAADGEVPEVEEAFQRLSDRIDEIVEGPGSPPPPPVVTDPSLFIPQLLKRRRVQPASSLQLSRNLGASFSEGADVQARLLVNLVPELKDTLYVAWANAAVNAAASPLQGVFVFRTSAPLFGATVQKQPTFFTEDSDGTNPHFRGQPRPQSEWLEWTLDGESNDTVFLDQPHEDIVPGGFALVQRAVPFADQNVARSVHRIADVRTVQRTAYGFSGKTTRLRFEDSWWDVASDNMGTLRSTLVYVQTERLDLLEEPVEDVVQGQEIALGRLYGGLEPGRWIILSGERADIPGVSGVAASELHMISGVRQDYDDSLPGDTTRTTLVLATPTAYAYQRASLRIYGNVVKATHGETRRETLGSGDASVELQAFSLKQPPLTFVPAPSASGVESTLSVYVNDVKWHEAGALTGAGLADRVFVTRTDDTGTTTVVFGNGRRGARLPTGVENAKAVYRSGIGTGGNVRAEQVSLLQTQPQGVKGVINPLRASGGADRESRDSARENAPLAVTALDRLISIRDYGDFIRTFAGIAKADARPLSDGSRMLVHITVAGADDIPIDPDSDLHRNLLEALRRFGDTTVPVYLERRELVTLVLSANVRLHPDYLWDPVARSIREALLDVFGFEKRALGQPALLCEVIAVIQRVPGVEFVDVDVFGGIPERVADSDGTRRLLTLEEIEDAVKEMTTPGSEQVDASQPAPRVEVRRAGLEGGSIHPAQLGIFPPGVDETITLNQVK